MRLSEEEIRKALNKITNCLEIDFEVISPKFERYPINEYCHHLGLNFWMYNAHVIDHIVIKQIKSLSSAFGSFVWRLQKDMLIVYASQTSSAKEIRDYFFKIKEKKIFLWIL